MNTRVALIAHDMKKDDIVALGRRICRHAARCRFVATGTTGARIAAAHGLEVERKLSGPHGGDLQIGADWRRARRRRDLPARPDDAAAARARHQCARARLRRSQRAVRDQYRDRTHDSRRPQAALVARGLNEQQAQRKGDTDDKGDSIRQAGGPEVMKWVDVEVGEPGKGEIRVKHHAVGLNYIDVYFRTGLYPMPLPAGLGMEAAGEVTAVGEGVTRFSRAIAWPMRRVRRARMREERVMSAEYVVALPDAIGYEDAASIMLQGLTAQYLLRRTYRVKAGDTMLIHAAAGGVGMLACQWAKALGATVIGTVGSDEKAELAKAHGCDYPIVYTRENFTKRVREITNGAGVPVVYDSIGKDTYKASLDCLAPLGFS